jgi:outer membrane biosynthesis protein TonB
VTVTEAEVQAQPSLAMLVVRALGVAALVVGVSAALFWTIGRGGDDGLVVADGPDDEVAAEDDEPSDEPSGEDPAPDPEPPADPEPEPEEPDEPDDGDPEPEPEPEEPAEPEEPEEPEEPAEPDRIDPATVSVQVLDGFQADGGAAATAVADELAAAGYRIVARNPAIAYDVTTVLWSAGSQAAGEQVARDLGAAEVRQQPGNLADSVMVHVVIGADRG